jgi:hypothetical protein
VGATVAERGEAERERESASMSEEEERKNDAAGISHDWSMSRHRGEGAMIAGSRVRYAWTFWPLDKGECLAELRLNVAMSDPSWSTSIPSSSRWATPPSLIFVSMPFLYIVTSGLGVGGSLLHAVDVRHCGATPAST